MCPPEDCRLMCFWGMKHGCQDLHIVCILNRIDQWVRTVWVNSCQMIWKSRSEKGLEFHPWGSKSGWRYNTYCPLWGRGYHKWLSHHQGLHRSKWSWSFNTKSSLAVENFCFSTPQGDFKDMTFMLINAGSKSSIRLICFGSDGPRNIYHSCRNVKSGPASNAVCNKLGDIVLIVDETAPSHGKSHPNLSGQRRICATVDD